MKTRFVIVDVAQCEGCNNCLLACKDEHEGNMWAGYTLPQPRHGGSWIDIHPKERGQFPLIDVAYLPIMCMHCREARCMTASGAVYRRADGIVIIDPDKARGNKDLVNACPYNRINWNESQNVPQKCTLCAHLLDDGWKQPRCMQACPTGALTIQLVDDREIERMVTVHRLELVHPEFKTRPRVYYKNFYRYASCFIAGSVAIHKGGIVDCARDARVTLRLGRQGIGSAVTDVFGDFRFDRLQAQSGRHIVEIDLAGLRKQVEVELLTESVNLGTIYLS